MSSLRPVTSKVPAPPHLALGTWAAGPAEGSAGRVGGQPGASSLQWAGTCLLAGLGAARISPGRCRTSCGSVRGLSVRGPRWAPQWEGPGPGVPRGWCAWVPVSGSPCGEPGSGTLCGLRSGDGGSPPGGVRRLAACSAGNAAKPVARAPRRPRALGPGRAGSRGVLTEGAEAGCAPRAAGAAGGAPRSRTRTVESCLLLGVRGRGSWLPPPRAGWALRRLPCLGEVQEGPCVSCVLSAPRCGAPHGERPLGCWPVPSGQALAQREGVLAGHSGLASWRKPPFPISKEDGAAPG